MALTLPLLLSGCGEGAKLVQATQDGGVVVYPFRAERGHLLSNYRRDAIRLIRERCPDGYRIVREGEARSRSQEIPNTSGTEVVTQRRWGIEFTCK